MRAAWAIVVVAVSVSLTACQAIPDSEFFPVSVGGQPAPSEDALVPPPEFVEGGSAEENLPYLDWVLTEAGAGSGTLSGADAVALLVDAGFDPDLIEVTEDFTSIQLAADSVTIAVRIQGACALGQWSKTWYSSSVGPVLGSGTCLLGDTASLD